VDRHGPLRRAPGGNILRANLKAKYSPYVVVDPRHVAIDCRAGEIIRERSMFPWWNHWPVSQQIRSNGRDRRLVAAHQAGPVVAEPHRESRTASCVAQAALACSSSRASYSVFGVARGGLHALRNQRIA
jgi:hypothetical protein